jgi:hypothetical protein
MIPEEIIRFLEDATVGIAATRDEALVPQLHHAESWSVGEDRRTITCLFASHHSDKLIPSLEDNGRFSFTALGSTSGPQRSQPPNPGVDFHECYQFKGDFVASRPANEADHDLVNRTAEKFKVLFQPLFGFSDRGCASRFAKPVLAITFEVHEIYNQTPGPGAGAKIGAEESS